MPLRGGRGPEAVAPRLCRRCSIGFCHACGTVPCRLLKGCALARPCTRAVRSIADQNNSRRPGRMPGHDVGQAAEDRERVPRHRPPRRARRPARPRRGAAAASASACPRATRRRRSRSASAGRRRSPRPRAGRRARARLVVRRQVDPDLPGRVALGEQLVLVVRDGASSSQRSSSASQCSTTTSTRLRGRARRAPPRSAPRLLGLPERGARRRRRVSSSCVTASRCSSSSLASSRGIRAEAEPSRSSSPPAPRGELDPQPPVVASPRAEPSGTAAARARACAPATRSETPVWSRYLVIPPSQNGKPAPRSRHVSTSAASATTPSSRMWRISSASASSTASFTLVDGRRPLLDDDRLVRRPRSRERRREREPVREGGVHRLEHVVRDARADHLQQHRRRHRQAEPEHRLVGLLEGVAVLERLASARGVMRVSTRLTTKPGASATSTPRLRSFVGRPRPRSRASRRRCASRGRARRAASPRPG